MLGIISRSLGVIGGAVLTALILICIAAASSGCSGQVSGSATGTFLVAQLRHDGSVTRCWFASRLRVHEYYMYLYLTNGEVRIAEPYNYMEIRDGDIAATARLVGISHPELCMGIPPTPVK